jgi:hypothetical protein
MNTCRRIITMTPIAAVVLGAVVLAPSTPAAARPCTTRFAQVADATPQAPPGYVYTGHQYSDVESRTASDAWAVGRIAVSQWETDPETGQDVLNGKGYFPLAEHWDGVAWQATPVPATTGAWLAAVDAVSSNDVWAVGQQPGPDRPDQWPDALVQHWNGTEWQEVVVPGLRDVGLVGVAAVSANDVWAVGNSTSNAAPKVLHWNGLAWVEDTTAANAFGGYGRATSVTGVAAVQGIRGTEVFVVGHQWDDRVGRVRPFVVHYNGLTWERMDTPDAPPGVTPGASMLNAVVATGPNDVWAVGQTMPSRNEAGPPLVLHFNGTTWAASTIDVAGALQLRSVDARDGAVWVGGDMAHDLGLFGRLEGGRWRTTTTAGHVRTVTITSPTSGWAMMDDPAKPYSSKLYRVATCR